MRLCFSNGESSSFGQHARQITHSTPSYPIGHTQGPAYQSESAVGFAQEDLEKLSFTELERLLEECVYT